MKHILILFCLVIGFGSVQAQKFASGYKSDTLTYAGAADTVIVYLGGTSAATATKFRDIGVLEIALRTDSLSGNPVATPYIEYSYDEGGDTWHRDATLTTINGAAPQFQTHTDASFCALRARVVCIAAATTQSERVRVSWVFKKSY